jgi:hypothetical protein
LIITAAIRALKVVKIEQGPNFVCSESRQYALAVRIASILAVSSITFASLQGKSAFHKSVRPCENAEI